MYFDVTRPSECGLTRKLYQFWLNDRLELQLNVYAEHSRKTKRHQFCCDALWNRLSHRDSTMKEKPEIESDVLAEAVELAKSAITVI